MSTKDLTTSAVDRQNVLNNPYALAEIERAAGMQGICEGACGAVEQSADQAKQPPEKRELGLGRSGQMPSLWRL